VPVRFVQANRITISSSATVPVQIVRVYSFDSNNAAGAFTQSFYGSAKLCPSGQTTIAACNTTTVHFNAYRSGSAQYVQSTSGMHQP
jgi:hypothetical protein